MIHRMLKHAVTPAPIISLVALLAAASVATADPPPTPDQPERSFAVPADAAAAIAKVWEAWFDAYERGDPDTLAGFFAEDGIYAANTGQMLRGRGGIREGVSGWVALKPRHLESYGLPADSRIDIEETLLRFRTAGEAVYRLSRFMILVEPSRCAMDAGNALSIWRRQADGEWRIESLLVNRDAKPPDEACGPRRKNPDA